MGIESQNDSQFVEDSRALFDIFIEGGYAQDEDLPLLDRLFDHFERMGNGN